MTTQRWRPIVFAALVGVVFVVTLAVFWTSSDDAYISFRYARNLAEGHGLVWNPGGERVEGYSNFLWVVLLAAGVSIGVPAHVVAPVLGVVAGVAILAVLAHLSASRSTWSHPWVWLPALALVANRSFVAWCTGGLETHLYTLLVLTGYVAAGRAGSGSRRDALLSAVLLAGAALTRPDGALFLAIAGTWLLVDAILRRIRYRDFAAWCGICIGVVGSHVCFRLAYYGLPLPNTYYVKVSGFYWQQGLTYLWHFLSDYHLELLLPLVVVGTAARRERIHLLFASAVVAYGAYMLSVGGDFLEFRFLVPILPAYVWLSVEGMQVVATRAWLWRLRPRTVAVGCAVMLVGCMAYGSYRPGAGRSRDHIESVWGIRRYAAMRTEQGRFLRRAVEEGAIPADLTIAVGGAGALPYFSDLHAIDIFGLNDREIATIEGGKGIVGHKKRATRELLERRDVDLIDAFSHDLVHDDPPKPRPYSSRYRTRARCRRLLDRNLLFVSLQPEDRFEQRLGALSPCRSR